MAITNITFLRRRNGRSEVGRRTSTHYYHVYSDDAVNDDETVIRTADLSGDIPPGLRIPLRGEEHPTDEFLHVKSVEAAEQEDSDSVANHLWLVTVIYETGTVGDEIENPLERPDRVQWGESESSEVINQDIDGVPILIPGANVPYDPEPENPVTDGVVTITRNRDWFDPNLAGSFRNTVNSSPFTLRGYTIASRTMLLKSFTGEELTENGIDYVRQTIVLHHRVDGWTKHLGSASKVQQNPSPPPGQPPLPLVIADANGLPLNERTPLKSNGQPVDNPAQMFFKDWDTLEESNFNDLVLPTGSFP